MQISSSANPQIKQIRSLLRQRKAREHSGLFVVEGIRLVTEALDLGVEIEKLVVAPDLLTSAFAQDLLHSSQQRGVPLLEVTAEVFRSISGREGPQGIGAVVRQRWTTLDEIGPPPAPGESAPLGWVALHAVQDPGNLGTILRTSDAVGAAGVILVDHTTDPHDPAALRASMGAVFSQRLVRATFAELIAWKQQHGWVIVGTSDAAAQDYRMVTYPAPLVLLMGSERLGLTPEQQAHCDTMVNIPMVGRSDSLNLAVATGVLLYAVFNQCHPV